MFNLLARQPGPERPASVAGIGNIAAGCILLFFVLPLIALVAVWIWCDSPGPVFEWESQTWPGDRRLRFLKFRSTRHDEPGWLARNHRTLAGKVLYYTRLEYLPNLANVAQGHIGLAELYQHHCGRE